MYIKSQLFKTLTSNKIYSPVGYYSSAIKINCGTYSIVHSSGFIGIDPKTNRLVSDNVEEQAKMALNNLKNLFNDNNISFNNIAKVTLFLTNMNDFNKVNEIYHQFINNDNNNNNNYPARSCVEVSNLPKNAKFEIEAIAYLF